MYIVSDVGITSNAISEFYDLKAKLMLTTEEMNNLERLKRMNNLEAENQKEYSIAKWITENYEKKLNSQHLANLHSQFGVSKSILTSYFYYGKKYIKDKIPMRAGKKIQEYIDEILESRKIVNIPKEAAPIIVKDATNSTKYYGIQVNKNTLKIFETEEFARCFLDGFNCNSNQTTQMITVKIGEN